MAMLNVKGFLGLPARGTAATFHATRACPTLRRLVEVSGGRSRRTHWDDARPTAAAAGYPTVRRCSCMREWSDRGAAGTSVRTVGGGLPTLGKRHGR